MANQTTLHLIVTSSISPAKVFYQNRESIDMEYFYLYYVLGKSLLENSDYSLRNSLTWGIRRHLIAKNKPEIILLTKNNQDHFT
jgi:hypothetical protein